MMGAQYAGAETDPKSETFLGSVFKKVSATRFRITCGPSPKMHLRPQLEEIPHTLADFLMQKWICLLTRTLDLHVGF